MKKIFTLLLLLSFNLSKAQHYTQGIPFDTTLLTGSYHHINGCSQMMEVNINLDPSLFNYVSGLQFMAIRDSIQQGFPGSTPTPIGDTIILNASNPTYSELGSYTSWFRIKLVGTPTLAGQTYPCNVVLNYCTCFCLNMTITAAFGSPTCSVDLSNSVAEFTKQGLHVFPNPVVNTLSVKGMTGKAVLRLYDPFGKLLMEQETEGSSTLNTAALTEGIYTLSADDGKRKRFAKVLIAR